jgi:hypothetical protein
VCRGSCQCNCRNREANTRMRLGYTKEGAVRQATKLSVRIMMYDNLALEFVVWERVRLNVLIGQLTSAVNSRVPLWYRIHITTTLVLRIQRKDTDDSTPITPVAFSPPPYMLRVYRALLNGTILCATDSRLFLDVGPRIGSHAGPEPSVACINWAQSVLTA